MENSDRDDGVPMGWLGRGPHKTWLALALAAVLALPSGAVADTTPVDLQLVLAVDASGSVDASRFELQKQGYAAAFANPRVLEAIRSGPHRAIAVAMMQWTGPTLQVDAVAWTLIDDTESATRFSDAIMTAPRLLFRGGTSISGAIDHAASLLEHSEFRGERRVIDISGDGANNSGRSSGTARDDAVGRDITINGLPILTLEPDLDTFYRDHVIGGPGSFVIAVDNYDEFAAAILRKLILEISAAPAMDRRVRMVLSHGSLPR